jgi:hypothetical protein
VVIEPMAFLPRLAGARRANSRINRLLYCDADNESLFVLSRCGSPALEGQPTPPLVIS